MVRIHKSNVCIAALLVAFVVSGCQSNKYGMAWKERSKPKPNIQGLEGPDEVAYWPYKVDKSKKKATPMPDQLKEKLAKKSENDKRDSQLNDLMKEGDQLSANGQYEDARLVYTRALMASPGNSAVHHRLAVVADKQHQYSAADEHYQAALRSRPRDMNVLSDLGYSYTLRGNLEQAEQTLKQALEIDRSHRRAMANLGLVYAKQDRRNDALVMFREGATEAEAQQFMASIFAQHGSGSAGLAGAAPSHGGPAIAATKQKRSQDLVGMSLDEIQGEMAREAQESKRKRYEADQRELLQARNARKLDDEWVNAQAAPVRVASLNRGDQNPNPPNGYPVRGDIQSDSISRNRTQSTNGQSQNLAGVTLYPSTETSEATNEAHVQHDQVMAGSPSAGGSQPPFAIERGRSSIAQNQRSHQLDPHLQLTRGQQPAMAGSNGARSAPPGDNASQIATQLGMSVGPGSLFPMVDGSVSEPPASFGNPSQLKAPQGTQAGGIQPMGMPSAGNSPMVAPSASYGTRFGGEFQQPQSYQHPVQFAGNQIQQASNRTMSNASQPERTDAGPAIAPASPVSNWGSPSNWQGGSGELPSWANQQPTVGSAGTGLDSGAGQSAWAENSDRRVNTMDAGEFGNQSSNRDQSTLDSSRPYNGSWPANANSLPNRPQSNVIINGRSSNGFDNQFGAPANQTGASMQNGSGSSVPQWPYTPK